MIPTSGPRRDTWTLKTALRPDFYEYFPRFSAEELDARLSVLPFWQATLLTEWNIREARDLSATADRDFERFVRDPTRVQRHRMADVLASVGITGRTVSAIAAVPRHRHAPPESAHLAYLNVHVPSGLGSCLTPPGLVAIMLDRLGPRAGETVVEFGVGSGYHLACAGRLVGTRGRAVGIDLRVPDHALGAALPGPLLLGDLGNPPLRPESSDAVYATCFSHRTPDRLATLVRQYGRVQLIGPINPAEFDSEPAGSWLHSTFTDHASYLNDEPQRYACVRTWEKCPTEGMRLRDSLYDVTFIPEYHPRFSPPEIRKPILT